VGKFYGRPRAALSLVTPLVLTIVMIIVCLLLLKRDEHSGSLLWKRTEWVSSASYKNQV